MDTTHWHIFRSYGDRSRMLGRVGHYSTHAEAMKYSMRFRRQGVMIVIVHRCRLGGACDK